MIKRFFDLFFSIFLLIVLSPIFLVLSILVVCFLGRPVFFSQDRPGLKGQIFKIRKFRSMKDLKDAQGHLLPDAERLTKFGRFLRKTSLDELPGLLNVLKGEMSFVGPRPLLVEYLPLYTSEQARRHDVRPGITGWAQVNGRNQVSWEEKFKLDVYYVDHQSFLFDLKIMFKTVLKVLRAEGVEGEGQVTMSKFEGSKIERPVRSLAIAPWPFFAQDEIESVVSVLTSGKVNYWTGHFVKQFENEFAKFHGMKHGLALANGTLTLELALWGLGIGPGDEVISTCRTFIASSSCIARVGATPVLTDVDIESQNMTAETIAPHITAKTKAIIVVHLAGWPCDMEAIMNLAEKHGLPVIEDCAQAHGARIKGKLVGSFGVMSSFSFCQDKIMTTGGEGGVLLLNDTDMYEKLWAFKDHGKSFEAVYRKSHPPGFRWLHESFGSNYRMTEMQGVIGLRQLEKLPQWIEQRNKLAQAIIKGVRGLRGLRLPVPNSDITHAYYKLYLFVKPEELRGDWDRDKIMATLNAEGIPCMVGSCSEIYLEKAFTKLQLGPRDRYQTAKKLGETSLVFLVHPTLDLDYAKDVVSAVKKVMAQASTSSSEISI